MSQILDEIESFLAEVQLSASRLGRDAVRDPNLVGDLRRGRRCWPETETRLRRYMDRHRQRSTQR